MDKPIGYLIDDKTTIRELLKQQATILPSEYDTSNWCYLPCWFQVKSDGKILAFNINQLPLDFKRQLESFREGLENKLKELS